MSRILMVFAAILATSFAIAQSKTVKGTVTDAENAQGLPGVNVIVSGTTNGTTTDINGAFSIELANSENSLSLSFTFVGYKTVTEPVGDRTVINVKLETDTQILEDVVIVGYGTQKKTDLTGSVSSLRGSDLTKIPSLDPTQALQGKVAGVQVTNASGAPGSQPIVRIRGVGTFNNSSPIYVVDGVILDDIGFLNSNDIQSMDVLKDASATAIYGSRGANGVIIVTTKQGKKGSTSPTINFTTEYSIQNQQKKIDLLNGKEYATIRNEITPTYNNVDLVPNTDWQDHIFRQAAIQNYQVSASGSSDKIQYYVGVGYFKQDGIIPKSSYERLTIRLNNIYQLSKSIRLGNNITFAPYRQQNTNGNVVFTAYRALPVIPVYQPDGSYSPVPNVGNPLADIEYTNSYGSGLRTVGNMYGEVDFLKVFTFKSSFGVDMVNNKSNSFTPVFFVSPQQQNSLSTLNKDWSQRLSWLWENTLTYNKEIGKHRINALAGYTMQEASSEIVALQGRNITRDSKDFWYINSNNLYPYATNINSVDPSQNYSIESILFRANYTYDNRFLFTATFRRDGSSKFAKENRYGNFPSLAAGWNVINESFMQGISFLSNLKVRGSWGIIGNEKIDYLRRYSAVDNGVNAVFGQTETMAPGLTYGVSGNPNLKWESTYQTDIGLETGFLNDKLTLEIDYYNRNTKDILIDLSVPGNLGNGPGAQITYNAGQVLNRGFEITLGWKDDISSDFRYSINANATTIYNKTLQVNGQGGTSDRLQGFGSNGQVTNTTPGVPIGSFYGYKVIGVFQNASDLASYPHLSQAGVGDLKYEDADLNGVLNPADRVNLGSSIPKILYGFNLGASYKSWDLSLDFNGISGNKIYNDKETVRPDQYNYEQHVMDRWTGEGTSNSEPRASSGGYNYNVSSKFIQNGSYFRMRSATLAYNLPSTLVDKIKMKSARFYVRGTNLFTLTKFTGYTPEVASSSPILNGIDGGTYPLPAVYSVGLNLTF